MWTIISLYKSRRQECPKNKKIEDTAMEDNVISWLLEDSNPAVQHRTRKELL